MFSKRVDYAAGTPQNPFSPDQIKAKFLKLSVPVVGEEISNELIEIIDKLESQANIDQLCRLLGRN